MSVLDLIFPKYCLECKKEGSYICQICIEKVRRVGWHRSDSFAIWRYERVIRKAIIAFKYKYAKEVGRELALYTAQNLITNWRNKNDYSLIAVPLFWHKYNLRGFNQSEEVGMTIAQKMKWEFLPNLVVKKKSTKPQVELKRDKRKSNLEGSFELGDERKGNLDGKNLIIFDDVYTTGSTLLEIEKILKSTNPKSILKLTLAK